MTEGPGGSPLRGGATGFGRNHAKGLHETKQIIDRPDLHDLAVPDAMEVHAVEGNVISCGGNARNGIRMRAATEPARQHFVSLGDLILNGDDLIRRGSAV